jgi:hypothetical protein
MSAIDKMNQMLEEARMKQEWVQAIVDASGSPWPNALNRDPIQGVRQGFLPPLLLSPNVQAPFIAADLPTSDPALLKFDTTFEIPTGKLNQYEWTDWTGQKLARVNNLVKTEDRFKTHPDKLPGSKLINERYSMRDFPLIFGDTSEDYFRFGLQTIDNLTPIENPENGDSRLRLDNFKGTPWEQQDPVYLGFDIIFDSVSSPLLNGSVLDFIANYSGVNEIASKTIVYDEFITQFKKFFRTNASKSTPRILNPDSVALTKNKPHYTGWADSVQNTSDIDGPSSKFEPGKPAYLSHYIKKIDGLEFLNEGNKGDTFKYFADYRKEFITITTTEDVTLSMGTLAHLYKLLYWSKPHGKHLIPDNLLRFNCEIVISEVRNMQRIRKNKQTQNIEVLKDNLSRWIFSLRECQFYFDKLTMDNAIDIGAEPKMFEGYTFNFDFKYSTTRLERFMPAGDWGGYVGYDNGSIWKIGNKRGGTGSLVPAVPEFLTTGRNVFNENGVKEPWILTVVGDGSREEAAEAEAALELFKKRSEEAELKAKEDAKMTEAASQAEGLKAPGDLTQALTEAKIEDIKAQTYESPSPDQPQSLDLTVLKKSEAAKEEQSSPFFDVRGSLTSNLTDSLKSIPGASTVKGLSDLGGGALKSAIGGGGLEASLGGGLNALTEKVKVGVPSLGSLKTKFSAAKTEATTNFFDVRGSLKSSLTDGLKNITNTEQVGGNLKGLFGNVVEKAKGGIPSLDSVKTKFSEAKTEAGTKFFDIRGGLKSSLTDGLKNITNNAEQAGGNLKGLFGGVIEKAKGGIPSLDSLKGKFSEAKTEAGTKFFDIRGGLKSSLTDGLKNITNNAEQAGGNLKGLFGNVVEKAKGGIPSLDSVKTKFSAAKTEATTNFFDVRGSLKSSLTDGLKKVTNNAEQTGGNLKGLFGNVVEKAKGGIPSLDSLKGKFSEAKTEAGTKFFDVRGGLKSSLTDGLKNITNNAEQAGGNLKGLFGNVVEKAKGGIPSLDSVKTKFSAAKTEAGTNFFDVRGSLKSSLTDGLKKVTNNAEQAGGNLKGLFGNVVEKAQSGIPSIDSLKGKFSEAKTEATTNFFDVRGNLKSSLSDGFKNITNNAEQAGGNLKGLFGNVVEKAQSGIPSLNSVKTKFSAAKTEASNSFFDIRGGLKNSISGGTSEIKNGLLNKTINKVYGGPVKSSAPPPSTSFFDLKKQLKDFLGGPLGDKFTEGDE